MGYFYCALSSSEPERADLDEIMRKYFENNYLLQHSLNLSDSR
jgi:hypothetical protein